MKHIACVSFGKDSLAMLLLLIAEREKNTKFPIDEVVFYNTGMEFEAIYNIRDKIVPILHGLGIKYIELKPEHPFEFYMFEKEIKYRNSAGWHNGYSWCGGACRWGTGMKIKAIKNYCGDAIQYVGIASDESHRFEKSNHEQKVLPLVYWNLSEKDCLQYCYDRGFSWSEDGVELYEILDRVSCWCCSNKNLKELRNIRLKLPKYWDRLKVLQTKTSRPMKGFGKSVFDLDIRFFKEEKKRRSDT